jgi:hypothetical protein
MTERMSWGAVRKLVDEPVTRPDGAQVILWEEVWLGKKQIVIEYDSPRSEHKANMYYRMDEVEALGNGNTDRGINRIGHAYYKGDEEFILQKFSPRLLADELDKPY